MVGGAGVVGHPLEGEGEHTGVPRDGLTLGTGGRPDHRPLVAGGEEEEGEDWVQHGDVSLTLAVYGVILSISSVLLQTADILYELNITGKW